ncbi:hypothetical protein KEM52_003845, partial [Ascosphaera acerosa]
EARFATAAGKATAELLKTVTRAVDARRAAGDVARAHALLAALNETVAQQLAAVQAVVPLAGGDADDDADAVADDDDASSRAADRGADDLPSRLHATAAAARDSMRAAAHALRQHAQAFDAQLAREVADAADAAVEVLADIRALGLEQVGLRWAGADGAAGSVEVAYDDWVRYNALKKQRGAGAGAGADDGAAEHPWATELRQLAVLHEGFLAARNEVAEVLDRGMQVAEQASAELRQAVEAGFEKIAAASQDEGEGDGEDAHGDAQRVLARDVDEEEGETESKTQSETDGEPPHSNSDDAEDPTAEPTIASVLAAERARDAYDFVEQSPSPSHSTTPSTSAGATSTPSQLQADLADATGEQAVFLDAKKRYYEAVGAAHDAFSSPSGGDGTVAGETGADATPDVGTITTTATTFQA